MICVGVRVSEEMLCHEMKSGYLSRSAEWVFSVEMLSGSLVPVV